MAHIQKRGPRRWVARYTDPSGRERAKSFERKVDAERFLTSVKHSMYSGTYVDPRAGRITFVSTQNGGVPASRTAQRLRGPSNVTSGSTFCGAG